MTVTSSTKRSDGRPLAMLEKEEVFSLESPTWATPVGSATGRLATLTIANLSSSLLHHLTRSLLPTTRIKPRVVLVGSVP